MQRLARYKTVGQLAGYVVCLLGIKLHFVVKLVEWWQPRELIDIVSDLCIEDENKQSSQKSNNELKEKLN